MSLPHSSAEVGFFIFFLAYKQGIGFSFFHLRGASRLPDFFPLFLVQPDSKEISAIRQARNYREKNPPAEEDVCTMCGKYCAIKQVGEYFELGKKRDR